MNLIKYILIIFLLNSCSSKSIISSNRKYFAESNSFEKKDNNLILSQKVKFNNTKNGLHNSYHNLTIELFNTSNLKQQQLLFINIDTTKINIKYDYNSNRKFNIDIEKIEGNVKILKITKNQIKIEEKICVFYNDKKVKYKGIRVFKKDIEKVKLSKMKRNRDFFCENNVISKGIKASFILRVVPDNGWNLKLRKNGTYKYYHWSGWTGRSTTLEKGNYTIKDNVISLISDNKKVLKFRNYLLKSVKGKKNRNYDCYENGVCKECFEVYNCINCEDKEKRTTYCLYNI